MIRQAKISDAQQILEIYLHHVKHTIVTFEEDVFPVQEMENRIEKGLEENINYLTNIITLYA